MMCFDLCLEVLFLPRLNHNIAFYDLHAMVHFEMIILLIETLFFKIQKFIYCSTILCFICNLFIYLIQISKKTDFLSIIQKIFLLLILAVTFVNYFD